MNIKAVILSDLKKRREARVTVLLGTDVELAGIDAAIKLYEGGKASTAATASAPVKKRKRRKLTPEMIEKMQAGRKAARDAKSNGAAPVAEVPVAKESHPRLPKGPKTASLAEAAE